MTRLLALLLVLAALAPATTDAQSRSDWHGTWVATDGVDTLQVTLDEEATLKIRRGGESPQMRLNMSCLWSVQDDGIRIETCTHMEAWSDIVPRDSSFVIAGAANSDAAQDLSKIASEIIAGARREGPALILRRDGDTLIYERK